LLAVTISYYDIRIVPHVTRGLAAKRRFTVRREQIDLLDIETLIETTLELDAERVAAGKASRRRNRNAADSQAAAR